jgi:hypothetical protein
VIIAGDVNAHRSHLEDMVQRRGYVWVRDTHGDQRCDLADPETTCLRPMAGPLPCALDRGHRGDCSSITFYCDACGRRRRGSPHRTAFDPDGVPDAHFCFLCVEVTR